MSEKQKRRTCYALEVAGYKKDISVNIENDVPQRANSNFASGSSEDEAVEDFLKVDVKKHSSTK